MMSLISVFVFSHKSILFWKIREGICEWVGFPFMHRLIVFISELQTVLNDNLKKTSDNLKGKLEADDAFWGVNDPELNFT